MCDIWNHSGLPLQICQETRNLHRKFKHGLKWRKLVVWKMAWRNWKKFGIKNAGVLVNQTSNVSRYEVSCREICHILLTSNSDKKLGFETWFIEDVLFGNHGNCDDDIVCCWGNPFIVLCCGQISNCREMENNENIILQNCL